MVVSVFVRAKTRSGCEPRDGRALSASGTQMSKRVFAMKSASRPTNSKSAGSTPTTVKLRSFNVMVWPTMSGRPPNRLVHVGCDRMATRLPPGRSSSGWKLRPRATGVPSTEKKFDDTAATARRAGTPLPVRTKLENGLIAAMPVKEWVSLPPVDEVRGRDREERPALIRLLPQHDEAIGLGVGKRLQEQRVAQTEDGGVGADAER